MVCRKGGTATIYTKPQRTLTPRLDRPSRTLDNLPRRTHQARHRRPRRRPRPIPVSSTNIPRTRPSQAIRHEKRKPRSPASGNPKHNPHPGLRRLADPADANTSGTSRSGLPDAPGRVLFGGLQYRARDVDVGAVDYESQEPAHHDY